MRREAYGVLVDHQVVATVDLLAVLIVRAERTGCCEEVVVLQWPARPLADVALSRPRIATVEVPLQPVSVRFGKSRFFERGEHFCAGLCPVPGPDQFGRRALSRRRSGLLDGRWTGLGIGIVT